MFLFTGDWTEKKGREKGKKEWSKKQGGKKYNNSSLSISKKNPLLISDQQLINGKQIKL